METTLYTNERTEQKETYRNANLVISAESLEIYIVASVSFHIGHSWQSKHKSCPDKLVLIATKLCRYPENMKMADVLGNAYVFPLQLLFLKATGGRYLIRKYRKK